jgi:hypothetical protein
MDPIKAYINTDPVGPNNSIPRYVAYRDAEVDYAIYGYGDTPEAACEDFIRNEAESICSECTECCVRARDCVLVEPNLSAFIADVFAREVELDACSDATHREWRDLNA